MENKPAGNGWAKWSVYVLKELERQDAVSREQTEEIARLKEAVARENEHKKHEALQRIPERLQALETEMSRMQVKSGIWGAIGAAIPVIAGYLLTR